MIVRERSLVLYKNRPALVHHLGDKLDIELDDGKTLKVRPKDITLLHPGPLARLADLTPPPAGEIKTAWELLAGQTTTLAELAELAFETFTPASAWAAWQFVADGLYFQGAPDAITANSAPTVAQEQSARAAKQAEEQAYADFLAAAQAGKVSPGAARFLREVEDMALGRVSKCRILRDLNRPQGQENAHALLLALGHWDSAVNPYPHRLGLPVHPPAVDLLPLPPEKRVDLTHLPAFAIDDAGSEDPDDALSLDGSRLWVHVADPAAVVLPGSPVDLEACARAAKLYLPEMSVPMLPPQATALLALGLTEISPALSFGLTINTPGEITGLEIVPSWVRVTRLSYEEAEAHLADEPFATFYRLAAAFEARRRANGAVNIDMPEVKVRVANGKVIIKPLPALKSRDLVREAMLMTGQAVARFAVDNHLPLPFTTQDVSEVVEPLPQGLAGMFARRRMMKRSQLSGLPAPHAGLGLTLYTQVTSPLRRYLDLVMHQQLRAFLAGQPLLDSQAILERVGAAESVTGSVRQAERFSNKHWTLVYLQQNPHYIGEGVLVELRGLRGTVLIPELDLITYLHLREELLLNSPLKLTVNRVDLPHQEAWFQLAA
jgi:exoribonuclease-2